MHPDTSSRRQRVSSSSCNRVTREMDFAGPVLTSGIPFGWGAGGSRAHQEDIK